MLISVFQTIKKPQNGFSNKVQYIPVFWLILIPTHKDAFLLGVQTGTVRVNAITVSVAFNPPNLQFGEAPYK